MTRATRGKMNYSEQELVAFVEQALAMGLQPTIHAMGSIGQSEPSATLTLHPGGFLGDDAPSSFNTQMLRLSLYF
jgi:hypothetical protein